MLKADVQGSVEAVAQAVKKLAGPKVGVDIIHKGVGAMTESDVMLAAASKGMVIGFNVQARVRRGGGGQGSGRRHLHLLHHLRAASTG